MPVRTFVWGVVAATPLAWLLLPGLLSTSEIAGFPTARVYARLHALWAAGHPVTLGFPGGAPEAAPDATTLLLAPLARLVGPASALEIWMVLSAAATLWFTWRFCGREGVEGWPRAAATAVATATPAVIAGLASGEAEVLHGWSLVALPLCRGWAALPAGLAAGLFAPALVPPALLLVLREARKREGAPRTWLLVGAGLAVACLAVLGPPPLDGIPAPYAWFSALRPAAAPERVFEVYVGFSVALALATSLAVPRAREWGVVGGAALVGALFSTTNGPERFLLLVPLCAAVGATRVVATWPVERAAVASVLAGTVLLAEGWKGVAVDLPLPRATLAIPDVVEDIVPGPVLDLPASPGGAMRGLWLQTGHRQPVTMDGRGRLGPDMIGVTTRLAAGECVDVTTLGFVSVLARREAETRDLAPLVACWGAPDADDGRVAVWTW